VLGVSLPGGPQAAGQGQGALGSAGAGGLPPPPGPPPIFKQEVRIVADEVTNSLVVLATRRDYQLILDVLKRIDVVPRQVVLEVMIAEVVLGKGLEFGISYAFSDGSLRNALPPTAADPTTDDDNDATPRTDPTSGTDLFNVLEPVAGLIGTAQRVPGAGGAFAVLKSGQDFQIFLNALQARTNVKMLAAPHVIAADNREAYILVGQSIPILTNTTAFADSNGTISNSVQYRDTGKILTVLPQVNSKGLVNLQIRQEVSAVLETRDGAQTSFGSTGSPAFSTREIDTTLVVNDGATVLMGGIIDDTITHTRAGVPYLMDIPVLGWAFRSERDINARTELLITITPYVVRNREEAEMVTEDFSSRIDGLRELRDAMRSRRQIRTAAPPLEESGTLEGVPVDER
jgi:general secretion pathway protein D